MIQKRSYKQYPKEFKEEAVALVTEQGYTVPKAAEALNPCVATRQAIVKPLIPPPTAAIFKPNPYEKDL